MFACEPCMTFASEFRDLCSLTPTRAFPKASVLLSNRRLMGDYEVIGCQSLPVDIIAQSHDCVATAYGGHQFGHYSRLGDGRAALFTEIITKGRHLDVQLKGSGRTAYSRPGTDGLATLSSVIREYIVSESMHGLGIPTTRGLAMVRTGEAIIRQGQSQCGGVLVRTAESFIRIGTFELVAREYPHLLAKLAQYSIKRHHLVLHPTSFHTELDQFVGAVADRHAQVVAKWMSVGFIHGVMNTDNASIGGLTIDYGPCAFMDEYKANMVFSKIDKQKRYAFKNQPNMAKWNIGILAKTFGSALTAQPEQFEEYFDSRYKQYYYGIMSTKLGLKTSIPFDHVRTLVDTFHEIMETYGLDFTNTFRELADKQAFTGDLGSMFRNWEVLWLMARDPDDVQRQKGMQSACPVYIPRNHLVQEAIDQTLKGDCHMMRVLLQTMERPYTRQTHAEYFTRLPTVEQRVTHTSCGT